MPNGWHCTWRTDGNTDSDSARAYLANPFLPEIDLPRENEAELLNTENRDHSGVRHQIKGPLTAQEKSQHLQNQLGAKEAWVLQSAEGKDSQQTQWIFSPEEGQQRKAILHLQATGGPEVLEAVLRLQRIS